MKLVDYKIKKKKKEKNNFSNRKYVFNNNKNNTPRDRVGRVVHGDRGQTDGRDAAVFVYIIIRHVVRPGKPGELVFLLIDFPIFFIVFFFFLNSYSRCYHALWRADETARRWSTRSYTNIILIIILLYSCCYCHRFTGRTYC